MDIKRAGSQASTTGSPEYFTGRVRIEPIISAADPARVAAANVTFEPGARTTWHTHPLGQTIIVTAGVGRAQREGGPVEEIRPGDIVWFETAMTHIAIQEKLNGSPVDWLEPVSDEDYLGTGA